MGGGQDAGTSDDSLHYLTAGMVSKFDIPKVATDSAWDFLSEALGRKQGDCFVGCGVRLYQEVFEPDGFTHQEIEEAGLFEGHAYSLLSTVVVPDTSPLLRLVQVRNPHGWGEWTGRYSDKNDAWTPDLRAKVPQYVDEKDGTFWMSFEDFSSYFSYCKIVDTRRLGALSSEKDKLIHVDGAASCWVSRRTAGGKQCCVTFEYNPRFQMTSVGGEAILTLYQPDTRHTLKFPAEQGLGEPFMGAFLYWREADQEWIELGCLNRGFGGGCGYRFQHFKVDLQAGTAYEFMASAERPGMQGAFVVTACGAGVKFAALPFKNPSPEHSDAMAAAGPLPLPFGARVIRGDYMESWKHLLDNQPGLYATAPELVRRNPLLAAGVFVLDPDLYGEAPESIRADPEIARQALRARRYLYFYAPDSVRSDRALSQEVFSELPRMFVYAPPAIRADKELAALVLSKSPELYLHAEEEVRGDRALATAACNADSSLAKFLPKALAEDAAFASLIIR